MDPRADTKLPECDLVMKGGITSGIVYPPALFELHKHYRFNSIGGTSAGAVAAAGAAAAEYGRDKIVLDENGQETDGFTRFTNAADDLNKQILKLFNADQSTQAIGSLAKAIGVFGSDGQPPTLWERVSRAWESLRKFDTPWFWTGAAIAAIIGALIGGGLWALGNLFGLWEIAFVVTGAVLGALIGLQRNANEQEAEGQTANEQTTNPKSSKPSIGQAAGISALVGGVLFLALALLPSLAGLRDRLEPFATWFIILVFALLGLAVGGAIGGALHLVLRVFLVQVPNNFYGIINGHDPNFDTKDTPTLLTDYMSQMINKIAGIDVSGDPLTFGDLCSRKVDGENAGITLQMVTTNLNHGLPYRLPFDQQTFLFNEEEMARLFPKNVVQYMKDHAYKSQRVPESKLPDGYHFVPAGDDFPVVVAMRMSLAIPIVFSAIPLHTIKASSYQSLHNVEKLDVKKDLQINYFSDGGTASNFPIHNFDRWLPTRPTFGMNLTAMPEEAIEEEHVQDVGKEEKVDKVRSSYLSAQDVANQGAAPEQDGEHEKLVPDVELRKSSDVESPEWRPVDSPFSFIMKVVDTARENHDNMQSMLPGYRERIVEIRFRSDEGGLNLAMGQPTIDKIKDKGKRAGEELLGFNFDQHRWTRFLVLMSQLEIQLEKLKGALERGNYEKLLAPKNAANGTASAEALTVGDGGTTTHNTETLIIDDKARGRDRFPYLTGHDEKWRANAYRRVVQLCDIVDAWTQDAESEAHQVPPAPDGNSSAHTGKIPNCDPHRTSPDLQFFNNVDPRKDHSPKPRPTLRVTPDL